MISPVIKQRLDQAKQQENSYRPSSAVLETLTTKEFVMIVGPSAIGKSTLMNQGVKLDKDFARVKNMTTRPRRNNDEKGMYEYIPHTDQGLQHLLEQIKDGELVQYAVHPTTGFIYGTYPKNYPGTYNMLDTQSQVVSSLTQLPFRSTHTICIVTAPEIWKEWFLSRHQKNTEDYKKRINEAIQSLEWVIAQPDESIKWLYNHPNDTTIDSTELVALTKGGKKSDPALRDYALKMLDLAYQMKQ